MDSAIMHTVASNEDSMVLAVPEPAVAAMANLKILYQLGAALGSSFDVDRVLDVVMDLVFEHVKADHGIILHARRADQRGDRPRSSAPARTRSDPKPAPKPATRRQRPAAGPQDPRQPHDREPRPQATPRAC